MMAQWGMKDEAIVDDPIYRARILQQLQACHGKGDDSLYQTMLEASMVRDEGMAKTLVHRLNQIRSGSDTMAGPLVSYTGAGHIQYNLPVPKRVARRLTGSSPPGQSLYDVFRGGAHRGITRHDPREDCGLSVADTGQCEGAASPMLRKP